jgi:hypothetical protein
MVPPRKATRKGGKRNNPNYQQLTAYVPSETWQQVKLALLPERREISELVQEQLENWLKARRPREVTPEAERRDAALQKALLAIDRAVTGKSASSPRERAALMARLVLEFAQKTVAEIETNPTPPARSKPRRKLLADA